MKTVKGVISGFKKELTGLYGDQEAGSIALLVLGDLTASSKARLIAFPEQELSEEQQEYLQNALSRLKTGEPVQYITGYADFYGLRFKVDPSVLIPRPETEELVEWILSSWRLAVGSLQLRSPEVRKSGSPEVGSQESEVGSPESEIGNSYGKVSPPAGGGDLEGAGAMSYSILDIGTGSGCIAISLKKNLPEVKVDAMDISVAALYTAKENAELNEVEINFIRQDILNLPNAKPQSSHSPLTTHYSLIVSNPPYVTLDDKKLMHTNVTDFEPHSALFVPEDDPLLFYKAIADFALQHLANNGLLFFEINESLGQQTVELLEGKGFRDVILRQDLSGRDRMIRARV